MAQHVAHRIPPLTLNTDGERHPLVNTLTVIAAAAGLLALITAAWSDLHLLSCWAGLVGMAAAVWGQYISETTAERAVLLTSLGAAAVGFGIGLAHGGPFGGLW